MKSVVCSAVNNMKDSGIKWLGMIPKHWNISALRYVSSLYTGNSISDEKKFYYTDPIDAIPYISTKDVDVNYQTINYNNGLYIKKNDSLFRVAPKGSVLMCIEGGSAGKKKAYTNQDVAFVNKLCCFLAGDSLFDKFLFYSLMSPSFEYNFNQYLTGIIGGVTIPVIKNIRICLPPLSEQRAIADWLDVKCADIDAAIELQQRIIDKLKAYKTAVIHQAVTKGLDKNANLKDSGVQWIGEVPEHWEVCHLGSIFKENVRLNTEEKETNALQFRLGEIISKSKGNSKYIPISLSGYNIVEPNVIMINGLNLSFDFISQRVALVKERGVITSTYVAIAPSCYIEDENTTSRYTCYLLKAYDTCKVLHSMGRGLRATLSYSTLSKMPILLPPLIEQRAIADWLDAKCADIDATIALKEQKQEKLKAYKKTIIFEYVTGKKQVANINKQL